MTSRLPRLLPAGTAIGLCLLAALALAAPGPLAQARQALGAGKLDEVLFALDGKTFDDSERVEAAKLLAEAGRLSFEKKDPLFALQFAQMALRQDPKNPEALEIGARACFHEQQFTPAEEYADRWIQAAPKSAAPRLFRAEIALSEGEWDHALALTEPITPAMLGPQQRSERSRLRARAKKELAERDTGLSTLRSLDARMEKAIARAKAVRVPAELEAPTRQGPSNQVVLYGTSWCGFCRKAREYFRAHDIPFEDKDIEKDSSAADELAEKAAAQHMNPHGVPVIDIHGRLVVGFNQPLIAQLLGIRG